MDPTLIPATDDAARQQASSRFFYVLGDILAGVDSQPRYEPGMMHNHGILGPDTQSSTDVGVGAYGGVYTRGSAGGATTAVQGGLTIPPALLLIGLGVAVFLALK